MDATLRDRSVGFGLSQRLLVLTVVFVLVGEVLIFVPSIARFRYEFLSERVAAGHLATLALEDGGEPGDSRKAELLRYAGVRAITLQTPHGTALMLGHLVPTERAFELRLETLRDGLALIGDAIGTLWRYLAGGARAPIRLMGRSPHDPDVMVDLVLDEEPLAWAMVDYAVRILALSVVLSLLTAGLLYVSLQWIIVRPLRRMTGSVAAFGERPEIADADLKASRRSDEIGVIEREIASMQQALRRALAERARLAALGEAVGKINHDLRNILSSAVLISDRIEASHDPQVRQVAPRLIDALDRATRLCAATLDYATSEERPPSKERFFLHPLVDEIGDIVMAREHDGVAWRNDVPRDLMIEAERDQIFRVLLNLGRNAEAAIAEAERPGHVRVSARVDGDEVLIDVADTGRGVAPTLRTQLFQPFAASGRPGGSGLGLAIARELARAHGGDLSLLATGEDGTAFRLSLPA